jgi:6-hydroxytryprostatin B O-methyltransferase
MPLSPLKRILCHLMLNHLFTEPKPGHIAHSEASRILVTEPGMTSWMGHNYDEVFRSFGFFPEALKRGSSGVADNGHPGKTATALAFDQPEGFFGGLLAQEPWRAKRFAEAMQAMTRGSHDHSHLADGYDWGRFGGGLVVDVSLRLPLAFLPGTDCHAHAVALSRSAAPPASKALQSPLRTLISAS